jgi:rhamnulokinase
VPAEDKDFAWISSGTWSIMGCEADAPCLDERALAYNFTNEGGVNGTWRLSKNIMGLWLVQECHREWNMSYDELTKLAAEATPFLAVIDLDDASFLHPGNMPEKICAFCAKTQQAIPQTKGEIIRVTLESLALKYRFALERLETLTGKRLTPLHIIGGGTKNKLLNQLTANSTGRTVMTGPIEATAIGNILMQAIALGHIANLSEARAVVRKSFSPDIYQPEQRAGWDEAYEKLLTFS